MCDMTCLRFLQKPGGGCHSDDAGEVRLRNASQVSDIFDGNAALKWDACKDLEFSEPLQTSEQLVLDGEVVQEVGGACEESLDSRNGRESCRSCAKDFVWSVSRDQWLSAGGDVLTMGDKNLQRSREVFIKV
jgi:hypothetical protein